MMENAVEHDKAPHDAGKNAAREVMRQLHLATQGDRNKTLNFAAGLLSGLFGGLCATLGWAEGKQLWLLVGTLGDKALASISADRSETRH